MKANANQGTIQPLAAGRREKSFMFISAQPKIRLIFNIGYAAANVKVIARKENAD
jgi:hypothetical protein